ncbi:hypothetical protein [Duganella lactea]|nr:hypothetical protein [Duganella lactea]
MVRRPNGQNVAVTVLREDGIKLSYAQVAAAEPMVGFLRYEEGHPAGGGMAYRTSGVLVLLRDTVTQVPIAHLNNPSLFDWNADGVVCEGWVLAKDPVTEKMRQVVQLWWIRNLEVLPPKPEIKPFNLRPGERRGWTCKKFCVCGAGF